MKISIVFDESLNKDQVEIHVHPQKSDQQALIQLIESQYQTLNGYQDDRLVRLKYRDIYYMEAIDEKVILYTKDQTYTSKYRLYQLEDIYPSFIRIHKSMIVNVEKIKSFRSLLNAKLEAQLDNGEKVEINRTYVFALKERMASK